MCEGNANSLCLNNRLSFLLVFTWLFLMYGTLICFASSYPDLMIGAWGGGTKECDSFRNPHSTDSADILVFQTSRKFSYGGYVNYSDDNISVKESEPNHWTIIDRHYDDGEGGHKVGYKNVRYNAQLAGDLLIIKDGRYISRFHRCVGADRPQTANMSEWSKTLVELLTKSKRYPPDALDHRAAGTVIVSFAIDRTGRLLESHIKKSSGFDLLDNEAIDALNRAQPFSPLPTEYPQTQIKLDIPMSFTFENAPFAATGERSISTTTNESPLSTRPPDNSARQSAASTYPRVVDGWLVYPNNSHTCSMRTAVDGRDQKLNFVLSVGKNYQSFQIDIQDPKLMQNPMAVSQQVSLTLRNAGKSTTWNGVIAQMDKGDLSTIFAFDAEVLKFLSSGAVVQVRSNYFSYEFGSVAHGLDTQISALTECTNMEQYKH